MHDLFCDVINYGACMCDHTDTINVYIIKSQFNTKKTMGIWYFTRISIKKRSRSRIHVLRRRNAN